MPGGWGVPGIQLAEVRGAAQPHNKQASASGVNRCQQVSTAPELRDPGVLFLRQNTLAGLTTGRDQSRRDYGGAPLFQGAQPSKGRQNKGRVAGPALHSATRKKTGEKPPALHGGMKDVGNPHKPGDHFRNPRQTQPRDFALNAVPREACQQCHGRGTALEQQRRGKR